MKKSFILFISLVLAIPTSCTPALKRTLHINLTRIFRGLSTIEIDQTHPDYVDEAAQLIPENTFILQLLNPRERTHPAAVVMAAFLTLEQRQDVILKALINAETNNMSESDLIASEEEIESFFSSCDTAKDKAPKAFEQSRKMKNFWNHYRGTHQYPLRKE
jgi:hypothetical protein